MMRELDARLAGARSAGARARARVSRGNGDNAIDAEDDSVLDPAISGCVSISRDCVDACVHFK